MCKCTWNSRTRLCFRVNYIFFRFRFFLTPCWHPLSYFINNFRILLLARSLLWIQGPDRPFRPSRPSNDCQFFQELLDRPVHGLKWFWPNHSWLSPCQVFFCFTRRSYSESPSDFKIDRFDWFLFRLAGGRPPVGSRLRVIWRPWCRATSTTKHRTRKL